CGVASTMVSIAGSSSTAASAPMVSRPCSAVKSRTRTGSRLTACVKRSFSLLPCTELTRVWPQRPSPTIAARIIASPGLSGYGAANLIPPVAKREGSSDRVMDLGNAERPDRPLQMPGMDHVPDGRDRADVRPVEPFRRLRQGKAALRDRALHERGGATDTRAEQAARRDALAGRR